MISVTVVPSSDKCQHCGNGNAESIMVSKFKQIYAHMIFCVECKTEVMQKMYLAMFPIDRNDVDERKDTHKVTRGERQYRDNEPETVVARVMDRLD